MTIFYFLIAIILIFAPNGSSKREMVKNNISPYKSNLIDKFLILITLISIVITSGFRESFIDTMSYRLMYIKTGKSLQYALDQTDKGFYLLMNLLNYISSNSQLLIFVSAVIVSTLIIKILYRYSSDFKMSVFLYVTTGCYTISMNAVRQFIGVSILFAALPLILDSKKWRFFIFVIIAASFHSSALIFIPIYFLIDSKVFSIKFLLIIFCSVLFLFFANETIPLLFSFLHNTNFSIYEEKVLAGKAGTQWIRVLVEAMPLILAYIFYKTSKSDIFRTNPLLRICTNFSFLNFMFYILALQSWIFARVSMYFSIYNLLLIPILLNTFLKSNNRLLFKQILYVLYFIYFIYQMEVAYNITSFPLNFNLF